MKLSLAAAFVFLMLPFGMAEAAPINAEFVHGLWYATEPIVAGVPNRIYVAFRNNTDADLTGDVHFLVDGTRIGSSDVQVLSGRIAEAWVDWTPLYGTHTVTASIDDAELHYVGGRTEPIELTSLAAEDTRSIDRDTDGDGIGDAEDPDDDNDTVSDEEEIARGSDPRIPNPIPSDNAAPVTTNDPSSEAQGLERFLDEGPTGKVLGAFTENIADAQHAVDAYRAERNAALKDDLIPESASGDIARTHMEKTEGSLWQKFVLGIGALLSHLWTLILWLLSNILAHPMVVQIGLLVGMLYTLYRIARRFGRRSAF